MIRRFIGDVHGKFRRYSTILDNSPHPTIQVGDMGVGFRRYPHGDADMNPPYDKMVDGGHRFIRGNHDNPAVCRAHTQCIADGTAEGTVMFIGGALSIDKAYRHERYSWWPDEELSMDALNVMISIYEHLWPTMMVTHECPEAIAALIVGRLPSLTTRGMMKMDPRFASRTRLAFEAMRLHRAFKPKLWVFGHWHVAFDEVVDGTRFICLPELAYADINVETAEVERICESREMW